MVDADSSEDDNDELVLDCEYEIGANETGFVLKWLLKDNSIYQWIPNHKPYALVINIIIILSFKESIF